MCRVDDLLALLSNLCEHMKLFPDVFSRWTFDSCLFPKEQIWTQKKNVTLLKQKMWLKDVEYLLTDRRTWILSALEFPTEPRFVLRLSLVFPKNISCGVNGCSRNKRQTVGWFLNTAREHCGGGLPNNEDDRKGDIKDRSDCRNTKKSHVYFHESLVKNISNICLFLGQKKEI